MKAAFMKRLEDAEARERGRRQRWQVADGRNISPEEALAAYNRMIRYVPEAESKPLPVGEAIQRYEAMVNGSGAS